ncbi:glycoside hydrolase family 3 C-terminal domain-containing protein [Mycetocola zhujimingii]|uniref:Exo-alpha-(1->6)-L-arabinopyranosidase n=1 Tax=Mycetocola zhujimingii TaxID=2079792 RepID=A0A2U1TC49_9MICO|nr:glycoside hydrolase family 3 C-terminal domain-containing protein [Mycetocola zhujimingii]PWC06467.1 glycosyl hydrolase [Mycetocola zhujimingii]
MTSERTTPEVLTGLSVEEKAALTSGLDFWRTKSVGDVPSVLVTDGPHGVRKQRAGSDHLGLVDSIPATCFPPAVGLGASFDTELAERVGAALGVESSIQNVAVLLGPGVNIKRSPLCGRNFEYFSEDPIVAGEIGAGWVRGVQSKGVGTSLKHFAANNQETDRLRISSDVDVRPLREIYLRAFQRVVEDAQPWTVMCSYNRINGRYASEDPWLLTTVLREEWGFEGLVMSDWGAVNDRVSAINAGLDLEMPSSGGRTDAEIVAAVGDGRLDESVLDASAARVASLAHRATEAEHTAGPLDVDAHHALAREAAGRSIVLLTNDGVLPLERTARLAIIGDFAANPRFQGAGSSLINPTRLDTALDEIRALSTGDVAYAQGFSLDADASVDVQASLRAEAVGAASAADVAVLFLGLPAQLESEGFDRTGIDLPAEQLALFDAVVAANPRTVVVLSHGGVVALPFADRAAAILDGSLLGQAGGGGTADVLFGVVNPSAKLTETIPLRLQDNPTFGNFPGEFGHVRYGEGVLVGYRWYDARELPVAFPFGHGLSYTTFSYRDAVATVTPDGDLDIRVAVTNSGGRAGREVVQVYTGLAPSIVERAPRELKAFAGVVLEPGETQEVALRVRRADLAYWDSRVEKWIVEPGVYRIDVASSSRDIRVSADVSVDGDELGLPITRNSTIGEVLAHPAAAAALKRVVQRSSGGLAESADEDTQMMMASFPVGRAGMLGITADELEEFLSEANA